MTVRLTISVPDDLASRIDAAAKARHLSVSSWLAGVAERRLFDDSMAGLSHDLADVDETQLRAMFDAQQQAVMDDGNTGRRTAA
jgi:hypothetical protein